MTRHKTAFDRDFDEWMKDPEFAEAYRRARAHIAGLREPANNAGTDRKRLTKVASQPGAGRGKWA